jgi:anti-anti-sigma factor
MGGLSDRLITVESKTFGATVEVIVEGEIDIASIARVAAPIGHALSAKRARLVVDLEKVEFLETTCIRLLESTAERAQADGVDFVVIAPKGPARRPLDMAGIPYVSPLPIPTRVTSDATPRAVPSLERVIEERRKLRRASSAA